ncbi:hypothetical protein STVA_41340 [Allostella vacuolata]|nr:hypothetical protein STVA_41340 [Stella vacuolata]
MAVSLTTGELLTLASVFSGLAGFAFTVWKYVEGKITGVRAEARQELAEFRADAVKQISDCRALHAGEVARLDARVEATRGECARREELQAINATLVRIADRFDDGMSTLHQRIDKLVDGRAAASPARGTGD